MNEEKRFKRWTDGMSFVLGVAGICSLVITIFVAIYIRPIDARLTVHVADNEKRDAKYIPIIEADTVKIAILETQLKGMNETLEKMYSLMKRESDSRRGE
jgi:hypothetical protein